MVSKAVTKENPARIKSDARRIGRPVDPAKDVAILSAARKAFLELPYDRVSMEAVAQHAGVSKVTIYAKYKSKEAVFLAAMNEGCAGIYDQALIDAGSGGPIREVLNRLGSSFMLMITSPEIAGMHAVMMREAEQRPELPRQFYETVVQRSIKTLAQALKVATERGSLSCPNPDQAAVQFVAMVQGTFRYEFELGMTNKLNEAAMHEYVAACVDLFLCGYKSERPHSTDVSDQTALEIEQADAACAKLHHKA